MVNKHECYAAFFNTEKVENHILGGKDEAYEKETQILCHCCYNDNCIQHFNGEYIRSNTKTRR